MKNTKIVIEKEEFERVLKEIRNLYQLSLNVSSAILYLGSELKRTSNNELQSELFVEFRGGE